MNTEVKNFYIVVRAGGAGSRLWPLSTEKCPKQFCNLTSKKSMLAETLDRLNGVVPKENIFISTNQKFTKLIGELLPDFPKKNLILEPARRDTAAAVALETITILKRNPNAIIASIGSDHLIRQVGEFKRVLLTAKKFIATRPEYLLLIGIKPTTPHTGFGYVEKKQVLTTVNNQKIYIVRRFTEKPNLATAKKFLNSKKYFWNGNLFVWRASTILSLFQTYSPAIFQPISEINKNINKKSFLKILNSQYPKIPKISIDYAILEKYAKIATIEADMGWSDIGDFKTLKNELSDNQNSNYLSGKVINIDTKNCLLFEGNPKKILTTIGLNNIGIIDTTDAILVCDLNQSQDTKKLIEKIKNEKNLEKYL